MSRDNHLPQCGQCSKEKGHCVFMALVPHSDKYVRNFGDKFIWKCPCCGHEFHDYPSYRFETEEDYLARFEVLTT